MKNNDYGDNMDDLLSSTSCPADSNPLLLERLRNSRVFTLSLFTVVVVLLYSDQNLMAPNLSAIADEFGLSDQEKDRKLGGDIAVAFFGFGAPASLLVGWLTDIVDRRKLFIVIVVLGEIGALATVFVDTYAQLFWTRAITGVAIGGGIPLVFSLMGDLVRSSRRTEASGAIGIAVGLGQGLGQVVGGFFGSCTSLGWRFPFLLMALPCLALTAVVLVATRDPPRGRLEQALQDHFQQGGTYTERPNLEILRQLIGSPTVLMIFLQGVPGCVPWGVLNVYLNDFLVQQRGLSMEHATMVMMVLGVATAIGQVGGARAGQELYDRNVALQPLLMGASTIFGVLPCVMLIAYTGGNFGMYVLFAAAGGILISITGPNVKSVLMNVTVPSARGSAFGVFNLFDDLGRGLGPAIISLVVVRLGREKAFSLAMTAWLGCGAILLAMAWTVRGDERKVQAHLRAYARQNTTEDTMVPLSASRGRVVAASEDPNEGDNAAMGDASKRRLPKMRRGEHRADSHSSSRDLLFSGVMKSCPSSPGERGGYSNLSVT